MKRCSRGHLLAGRNVFLNGGYEKCRTCRNDSQKALRAKKAAEIPKCPTCGGRMPKR